MKQAITGSTLANEVRMSGQVFPGAYCLVEGQSDIDFYSYFFNLNDCRFIAAFGKEKALDAMARLNGHKTAFSILDADFQAITNEPTPNPHVFFTDTHDSETMVIRSDAFKKTLNNYSDVEKLNAFLQKLGKQDIREVLLISGLKVGYLRLLSEVKGYMLNFKRLDLDNYVGPSDLNLDLQQFADDILYFSARQSLTSQILLQELAVFQQQQHDPWVVVCGHDLIKALVAGLRTAFGRDGYVPAPQELERGLRQAFETAHFTKTRLYKSIKNWSETDLGRKILRC